MPDKTVQHGASDADAARRTGERLVPGGARVDLELAHRRRYEFAARLAEGRCVLDLGSGEGYGAAELAARASCVVAVDRDAPSLVAARRRYRAGNLHFAAMDVTAPALRPGSFDVVTAFEIIEHLDEPDSFLGSAAELLRSDGVCVLSTPNRPMSSPLPGPPTNPFHVREYTFDEVEAMARRFFGRVELHSQRNPHARSRRRLISLLKGDVLGLRRLLPRRAKARLKAAISRSGDPAGHGAPGAYEVVEGVDENSMTVLAVCRRPRMVKQ